MWKKCCLFQKTAKKEKKISLLRNAAHFTKFLSGDVRPKYSSTSKETTEYYPCSNCKGLYSKKYLSRHGKSCIAKDSKSGRSTHLSASQTLIACSLERTSTLHKLRVKEEVFNIMKADEISLTAKTDTLICHFGENYLKKHKRKQMAVVCSNKMRELARLIEGQN